MNPGRRGRKSERDVNRLLGRAAARRPGGRPRRRRRLMDRWVDEETGPLTTDRAEVISRRIGRRVGQVRSKRQHLKIPCFGWTKKFWTEAEDKLVGTRSDHELATQLGRTAGSVKKRRNDKG